MYSKEVPSDGYLLGARYDVGVTDGSGSRGDGLGDLMSENSCQIQNCAQHGGSLKIQRKDVSVYSLEGTKIDPG